MLIIFYQPKYFILNYFIMLFFYLFIPLLHHLKKIKILYPVLQTLINLTLIQYFTLLFLIILII